MPLCIAFDSNMFPRLYSSFDSGPKSPLVGAWPKSPKSSVSLVGATKSLKLQNPSSFFAIPNFLLEILDSIIIDNYKS
jgi:hypothetical protein